MIKRAVVIFSGYNQRAVISFCRVAQQQNVPLIIIAKSESDPILESKYREYVKYIRKNTELDLSYVESIFREIKIKAFYDEYIVLPSSEALNRFLLDNRAQLEELGFIIPLVDKQIYEMISDKYVFGNLCTTNNIQIPKELDIIEDISFPVVIKPKTYFTSDRRIISPCIIKEKIELENFIADNGIADFYIQEYICGESYYLLYYFCKDGTYEAFSQKNILQQSKGKSIIAAITSDIHNKEISERFIQLFKKIKFTGLVMVEIKYFNEKYFMIEANPRLWGPSQLFVDSGCKFFELFLKDCGFDVCIDKRVNSKMNVKYFWLGGLLESLHKYGEFALHTDNHDFLKNEIINFLSNDIYLREDTSNIFIRQILEFAKGDKI